MITFENDIGVNNDIDKQGKADTSGAMFKHDPISNRTYTVLEK